MKAIMTTQTKIMTTQMKTWTHEQQICARALPKHLGKIIQKSYSCFKQKRTTI